ncbi:hypothetical protein GQX74_009153 [Glossina fuscipes]|nr:hypothetical protein GQX74_009153 [Glossina fuscipes]
MNVERFKQCLLYKLANRLRSSVTKRILTRLIELRRASPLGILVTEPPPPLPPRLRPDKSSSMHTSESESPTCVSCSVVVKRRATGLQQTDNKPIKKRENSISQDNRLEMYRQLSKKFAAPPWMMTVNITIKEVAVSIVWRASDKVFLIAKANDIAPRSPKILILLKRSMKK